MANYVGSTGYVKEGSDTLAEITDWSFNTSANVTAWGSSSSAGFKKRKAGTKDGSGSFSGKLDDSDVILDHCTQGAEVTLKLGFATGKEFTVPAVVESVDWKVDIDSGEVVGWTVNFGSNGAWTEPTFA
jgi:hypothetical protein